jgi:hypothetical protein
MLIAFKSWSGVIFKDFDALFRVFSLIIFPEKNLLQLLLSILVMVEILLRGSSRKSSNVIVLSHYFLIAYLASSEMSRCVISLLAR